MTARRIVTVLVGLCLLAACLGQGCPPAPPATPDAILPPAPPGTNPPPTDNTTTVPELEPEPVVQQGIPEGLYIGENQCIGKLTLSDQFGTDVSQAVDEYTITRIFGPGGNELAKDNTPIQPGDRNEITSATTTDFYMVTLVDLGPGRLVILSDLLSYTAETDGTVTEMIGTKQAIYEVDELGNVEYTSSSSSRGLTAGGVYISHDYDCTATLE